MLSMVVLVSAIRHSESAICIHMWACVLSLFSRVQLFATLWTVACQAPLSMEFSKQEYWEWVTISFSRVSS